MKMLLIFSDKLKIKYIWNIISTKRKINQTIEVLLHFFFILKNSESEFQKINIKTKHQRCPSYILLMINLLTSMFRAPNDVISF